MTDSPHKKVWDLIRDIRFAVMVSRDLNGKMHGRPMAAANKDFSGELWFFTSSGSAKVAEIAADPHVIISYAEPKKQDYLCISGTAELVKDNAKIKELWSEPVRVWFPKGQEDPQISLIRVTVETAEYWDSPSAALVQIYGYVKARVTGERPADGEIGEHRKVSF